MKCKINSQSGTMDRTTNLLSKLVLIGITYVSEIYCNIALWAKMNVSSK
jgi:hypothetical protein